MSSIVAFAVIAFALICLATCLATAISDVRNCRNKYRRRMVRENAICTVVTAVVFSAALAAVPVGYLLAQ